MTHKKKCLKFDRGSVLILTLMALATFVVISIAWSQLAVLQSRNTVDQEQEEHAFFSAEYGVETVLSDLNSGSTTPSELVGNSDGGTVTLGDSPDQFEFGSYTLSYKNSSGGVLEVTSLGRSPNSEDRCQSVIATIDYFTNRDGDDEYYIEKSDHLLDVDCDGGGTLLPPADGVTVFLARDSWGVEEGGYLNYEVRLNSVASVPVQVTFRGVGGVNPWNAEGGVDFDDSPVVITFSPGETLKSASLATFDDSIPESWAEILYGTIYNSNASIGNDTMWTYIQDND